MEGKPELAERSPLDDRIGEGQSPLDPVAVPAPGEAWPDSGDRSPNPTGKVGGASPKTT